MSTIAFVPVRGGSKSIPLKNIKLFCGKPLVYWCLQALQKTMQVDRIVVATDSKEIVLTVLSFDFSKVEIYNRSSKSATDFASTENVMLEYLNQSNDLESDIFVLVQATSPFTTSFDLENALHKYEISNYDSMLTCVRLKRFFWNESGTPKNYDFQNRPRRQNFKGELMENGAFYINTVKNIKKSYNRLSGKIGIYEMPEHTGIEIDEPDDWRIAENLMKQHSQALFNESTTVKLFLTDVDGVLTDAGMYYSEHGDELKKFNTKDGMGLQLLREAGIKTGILTSEETKIVERRATKLKVNYLYQTRRGKGKLEAALEICQKERITLKEVAYIGDDINCFDLLSNVGYPACPSDAVEKIKMIPNINILSAKGGQGVVREFAELILK